MGLPHNPSDKNPLIGHIKKLNGKSLRQAATNEDKK